MVYKFKLASKFQVLEFEIEAKERFNDIKEEYEDDLDELYERVKPIADLINRVGDIVENPDKSRTAKKATPVAKAEGATERQISMLESYGIDAKGMSKKEAWERLNRLKNG